MSCASGRKYGRRTTRVRRIQSPLMQINADAVCWVRTEFRQLRYGFTAVPVPTTKQRRFYDKWTGTGRNVSPIDWRTAPRRAPRARAGGMPQCTGPTNRSSVATCCGPSLEPLTSPNTWIGLAAQNRGRFPFKTGCGTITRAKVSATSRIRTVAGWHGSPGIVSSMSAIVPRKAKLIMRRRSERILEEKVR